MMGERVALLIGLFVVPGLLLWLGHSLRERSARERRVFWGGVVGHSVAMIVTLAAALTPPIWWAGGNVWRDAAVHWTLALGALLGALLAAVLRPRPAEEASPP